MRTRFSLGIFLLLCSAALSAADISAPDQLASCAACHGDQGLGNPTLGAPRLAGQHASYLAAQLQGFRDGRRGYAVDDHQGLQMRAIAASLTDGQIDQLSQHYSELSLPVEATSKAGSAEGEALYQQTCAVCHGPAAEGFSLLRTPNLRLLDTAYMERQLVHFTEGSRGGNEQGDTLGIWMRGIALQIEDAAARSAILAYISSLN